MLLDKTFGLTINTSDAPVRSSTAVKLLLCVLYLISGQLARHRIILTCYRKGCYYNLWLMVTGKYDWWLGGKCCFACGVNVFYSYQYFVEILTCCLFTIDQNTIEIYKHIQIFVIKAYYRIHIKYLKCSCSDWQLLIMHLFGMTTAPVQTYCTCS